MANNVLRAGITPDDGSAQGFPSASTPHDGSLPLIGDTFMEQPNGPSACGDQNGEAHRPMTLMLSLAH